MNNQQYPYNNSQMNIPQNSYYYMRNQQNMIYPQQYYCQPTYIPTNFYNPPVTPIITQQPPPIIYQQDIYHTNYINPEDFIEEINMSEKISPKYSPPKKVHKKKTIKKKETIESNVIVKENIIKNNETKEIQSTKSVLLEQIEMIYLAEEITTYEKSILDELALIEDPELIAALNEYIRGSCELLINILHRKDNYSINDEEIAKIISEETNKSSYTRINTKQIRNSSPIRNINTQSSYSNSSLTYDVAAILRGDELPPILQSLTSAL